MITCQNVSVRYGAKTAVSGVSFALEAGDMLYIVGENGSGKSTLIKAVLGLVKLSGGRIVVGAGGRSAIGYMPQQVSLSRDFPAVVSEVVMSGCLNRRILFYRKEDRARAALYMNRLDIMGLRNKPFHELSGGQRQRVLLARALCAGGSLLVLDEPTAGLDPAAVSEFYALLQNLNREQGVAVMMVSHDIRRILEYNGKILHLQTEQAFFGDAPTFRRSEAGRKLLSL